MTLSAGAQTIPAAASLRANAVDARRGEAQRRGRPPGYTLEQILTEAIRMLDAGGERSLTLRGLASELGAGVGSIYWYVASKDELLDQAADQVLQGVLDRTHQLPDDPYAALRALAIALYEAMQEHPWVGAFMMRDPSQQSSSMHLYERFGRQTQRLALTARQRFHAVSSLMSFVVGVGAEIMEAPPALAESGMSQREALELYADMWRALPADEFPFAHEVADEFARHLDAEQFEAGIDLILAGLKAQERPRT